jgi:hypothetical protein
MYKYRPKKNLTQKAQEARMYGAEPAPGSDVSSGAEYGQALNWYSRCAEPTQLGDWILETLLTKGYNAKQVRLIIRSGKLLMNAGAVCRMISNGCILPAGTEERLLSQVEIALKAGLLLAEEREGNIDRSLMNPAARNKAKALQMRGDIDELIDTVWEKKIAPKDVDLFAEFIKWGMKGKQARILLPFYQAQLEELQDDSIGHSKERKILLQFYLLLVDGLKTWTRSKDDGEKPTGTGKRGRPKKVNIKRPVAMTGNLKYKSRDDELRIVSADPKHIIGASMVVLFNAKYNQLFVLRASGPEGLSVKGTTILNVDEASSSAKRAGRHIATIRDMATMSKSAVLKAVSNIDSADIEVRTRCSDEVLIVRVLK